MSSHTKVAEQVGEPTESASRTTEARFRQLVEAVPDAILEVDTAGRLVLVNEAAEKMFGYHREELYAMNVDALVPDTQGSIHTQHRSTYARNPIRRPMGSGFEQNAKRKDGSVFPVEISLSPNCSAGTLHVIALVRDITERRKAEAQLEANRAQLVSSGRLAALGRMAGGVAHEINNPLSIIHASASDLLRAAKEQGVVPLDSVVHRAERIQQTANRITKIIKNMLYLSREGSRDRFCPTSVTKIVEQAAEICKERFANHSVRLTLPSIDSALFVSCREVQIAQVLLNLLQNAFDAVMQQAGKKWICLEVAVHDGSVLFSVTDSGPGVPPGLKRRIMEPFFTTKEVGKGTGLGLSLSRTIVEEHGGMLELTEAKGHTCFVFRLPLVQKTEAVCN